MSGVSSILFLEIKYGGYVARSAEALSPVRAR